MATAWPDGPSRPGWSRAELDRIERRCREAFGVEESPRPGFLDLSPLLGLLAEGADLEADIVPVLRARRSRPGADRIATWAWFVEPVAEAMRRRRGGGRAAERPVATDVRPVDRRDFRSIMAANGWRDEPEHFDKLCRSWFEDGRWPVERGPKPGEPDGFVPLAHVADWLRRHPHCAVVAA